MKLKKSKHLDTKLSWKLLKYQEIFDWWEFLKYCRKHNLRGSGFLWRWMYISGSRSAWLCGLVVYLSLYGLGIAYTITSSISLRYNHHCSMGVFSAHFYLIFFLILDGFSPIFFLCQMNGFRAIRKSNCYHREGHDAACEYGDNSFILIFGAIQIVTSQIPNFHDMKWLTVVAAIMSCFYSFIGFGLGLAKTVGEVFVFLNSFFFFWMKGNYKGLNLQRPLDKDP